MDEDSVLSKTRNKYQVQTKCNAVFKCDQSQAGIKEEGDVNRETASLKIN